MKFCEKLQKLRKEKGLSQEQLADMLDVSRQSVSKWESGSTYPEMDKLIMICKIFNVTLDDLTNDAVTDQSIKEKSKGSINNAIYAILDMISKSVLMFKSMSKKELSKCITEMLVLIVLLLFCSIPFSYIDSLARNIFVNFGDKAFAILFSIWTFFSSIIYLVLFVVVFVYFYKTRYLDKYDLKKQESEVLEEDIKEENNKDFIKEEYVVKEKNPGFILFDVLGRIFTFFVKFCLLFIIVPIILLFFVFVLLGTMVVVLLFRGVMYPSILIGIVGCIILTYAIMKAGICFLVNYKVKLQKLFLIFVIGLFFCSVGSGLLGFDIAQTKFINDAPVGYSKKAHSFRYTFKEGQYIDNQSYYFNNVSYEVDDTLGEEIIIDVTYYDEFVHVNVNEDDKRIFLIHYEESNSYLNLFNLLVRDLKEKTIYDYSKLYQTTLVVKSSSEVLAKLKNNYNEEMKKQMEMDRYLARYEYEKRMDDLIEENDSLREDLENANDKILELEAKIEEIEDLIK